MKKLIGFFSFLFSLVILFSCEPGRDENGDLLFGVNGPNQNGGSTGQTKLLKKMTATDINGEVSTINYNYNSGILSSVNVTEDGDQVDISLTYDKNKLSKMVMSQLDGSTVVTTTINLIYTNGKLTGSTGKMEAGGEEASRNTTSFTYDTSGNLKMITTSILQQDIDNPGSYVEFSKQVSELVFTGNNISSWKMTTSVNAPPPFNLPPIVFEVKLSNYDTFKNPLATLPLEFNIAGAHFLAGTNSVQGLSLNNYKTASIKTDGVGDPVNYVYTYDGDGYPTTATASQGVLKYEYTKP